MTRLTRMGRFDMSAPVRAARWRFLKRLRGDKGGDKATALPPRRRFRKARGPLCVPSMLKRPMRVRRITSPAERAPAIASHSSRLRLESIEDPLK